MREGWTPAEDTLPERFLTGGASAAATTTRERLAAMIRTYNQMRGWAAAGEIPAEQLAELESDTKAGS